jgi:hypothetical protein
MRPPRQLLDLGEIATSCCSSSVTGPAAEAPLASPLAAASPDWASGDVIRTVIGQHDARLDELEAVAASIDELLP